MDWMRGYSKPIQDNKAKSRARATVQAQLNAFKVTTRGVVQRAMFDDEHRSMFKPVRCNDEKFINLALKGKFPAIDCGVLLSQDEITIIEHNILTLGRHIANKKVKEYCEGKITLKPNNPVLKGRAGWDSNIKVCGKDHVATSNNAIVMHEAVQGTKRPHEEISFHCPKCQATCNSNKKCFQLQDLDKVSKCRKCKANVKVRDWLCSCGNTWHLCAVHRSYCSSTNTKKPPCNGPGQSSKRMLGPLTTEQLQQYDNKRMRRSNDHLLQPAPNILSCKLRERFAYLFDKQ